MLKSAHGSGAAGCVAIHYATGRACGITTVVPMTVGGEKRLYFSKRPHHLPNESAVAALVEQLCVERVQLEVWLPKARLQGRNIDLRVVTIDGEPRHTVVRSSTSVFTNLTLGSGRADLKAVIRRIGPEAWQRLRATCAAVATAFPNSFTLGIDILIRPDWRRHEVLEVNAFGDLLLNELDQGEDTYTATLNAWQRRHNSARSGGGSIIMNMNDVVGRDDLMLITFDTLRFDVAQDAWRNGETPNLGRRLPPTGWQRRHSPASFTFAAHAGFFRRVLANACSTRKTSALFALQFPGSETVTAGTCVLDRDSLVTGLAQKGYHTICIGGVGFFNKLSPLGNVFPSLFAESYWSPQLGVTHPESTANQVRLAVDCLKRIDRNRRVFLFVNVSALHQPNHFYVPGASKDSLETHRAALRYIDREIPPLFEALEQRGTGFGILCSDHGTAYGEAGYHGHRLAHPVVWDVPYAEFTWGQP